MRILFCLIFILMVSCSTGDIIEEEVEELLRVELMILNEHRINHDLLPLQWSNNLELVALYHSQYMSDNRECTHDWTNGTTLGDRLIMFNLANKYVAENVICGHSDISEAVEACFVSSEHNDNILNSRYTKVAVVGIKEYCTMILSN